MSESGYCIYIHTNKKNGKVYIGQTCQELNRRFDNGRGYAECPHFHNAIEKYGWDGFSHDVLESGLTLEEANEREAFWIDKYNSTDDKFGYNLQSGGKNCIMAEETKQKISESTKGTREGENNPMYGKTHSVETRLKMKETQSKIKVFGEEHPSYGTRRSDDVREKMSKSHIGKKQSEETVEKRIENSKISRAMKLARLEHPEITKHTPPNDLARKAQSERMIGHAVSEETREKISKSSEHRKELYGVLCVESGIVFKSCAEAARHVGVSRKAISVCCKGKTKTSAGFHWKFVYKKDADSIFGDNLWKITLNYSQKVLSIVPLEEIKKCDNCEIVKIDNNYTINICNKSIDTAVMIAKRKLREFWKEKRSDE